MMAEIRDFFCTVCIIIIRVILNQYDPKDDHANDAKRTKTSAISNYAKGLFMARGECRESVESSRRLSDFLLRLRTKVAVGGAKWALQFLLNPVG